VKVSYQAASYQMQKVIGTHTINRNLVSTKRTMDQRGSDKSHSNHLAASETPGLGPKEAKNSNRNATTGDKANQSAAMDQWLEEMPHQEYWNAVARVDEGRAEEASKK
jgi:hypothetical protein